MGMTATFIETWDLGNHRASVLELAFTGQYPSGGYDCPCALAGLTELAGAIPLHGQDGFTFDHCQGMKMRVYRAGHEVAGNQLDGSVVTMLFVGH